MDGRSAPSHAHLRAISSAVFFGLLASSLVPLATYQVSAVLLGSELSLRFDGAAQFGALVALAVACGVSSATRARASGRTAFLWRGTYWPVPTTVAIVGSVLVSGGRWWGEQAALALMAASGVAVVLMLQAVDLKADGMPGHPLVDLGLLACAYGAAGAMLCVLYGTRARSLLSASGVALVSSGVALDRLRARFVPGDQREDYRRAVRTWLYAGIVGLLMGQLTWAMNYLDLAGRVGGVLLLLALYTAVGVVREHLEGESRQGAAVEHLVVLAIGFLAVIRFGGS